MVQLDVLGTGTTLLVDTYDVTEAVAARGRAGGHQGVPLDGRLAERLAKTRRSFL